jgi:hypothetical protein
LWKKTLGYFQHGQARAGVAATRGGAENSYTLLFRGQNPIYGHLLEL